MVLNTFTLSNSNMEGTLYNTFLTIHKCARKKSYFSNDVNATVHKYWDFDDFDAAFEMETTDKWRCITFTKRVHMVVYLQTLYS